MSDVFYSIVGAPNYRELDRITVATSSTSANPIEVRVTDDALSAKDVYDFLEWIADLFASRNSQVITSVLTG